VIKLKEQISENVVIVAKNLNPSLFSQLWLIKQGIVSEEGLMGNCVFTPFVTQVFTTDFQLFVVPEQLQFTLSDKSKDNSELIKDKLGSIIQKIPHTPYVAIGTNFHWKVAPDLPTGFVEFMRNLFMKQSIPLYSQFSESDARFGAYLSKDIFGSRLKLNVTPVRTIKGGKQNGSDEFFQFAFNYHLDLVDTEQAVDKMLEFLEKWNAMKRYSEDILSIVLESSK